MIPAVFDEAGATLYQGDCLDVLRQLPDASIDAIVTDPPYGLSFMGKKWDYDVPSVDVWRECLRVLKPGGHLLAFAGTRTQHRMCCRIEDAGFEIRDMIAWVYGSGFPKSHNLDGQWFGWGTALKPSIETITLASKPLELKQERHTIASSLLRLEARLWLLSCACVADLHLSSSRSELDEGLSIARWSADDVTRTLVGLSDQMDMSRCASAIDSSLSIVSSWRRVLDDASDDTNTFTTSTETSQTIDWRILRFSMSQITLEGIIVACSRPGGFDANASIAAKHFNASLLLWLSTRTLFATEPVMSLERIERLGADVSPSLDPVVMARKPLIGTVAENVLAHGVGAVNVDGCRVGEPFISSGGPAGFSHDKGWNQNSMGEHEARRVNGRWPANLIHDGHDDVVALFNGAARFFYCAKASNDDRDEGLDGVERVKTNDGRTVDADNAYQRGATMRRNSHPTVKPVDLMRYLCRLITPPGGVVLDQFTGSGSTGKAAMLEGFRFIGIEREAQYCEIAARRIRDAQKQPSLLGGL